MLLALAAPRLVAAALRALAAVHGVRPAALGALAAPAALLPRAARPLPRLLTRALLGAPRLRSRGTSPARRSPAATWLGGLPTLACHAARRNAFSECTDLSGKKGADVSRLRFILWLE